MIKLWGRGVQCNAWRIFMQAPKLVVGCSVDSISSLWFCLLTGPPPPPRPRSPNFLQAEKISQRIKTFVKPVTKSSSTLLKIYKTFVQLPVSYETCLSHNRLVRTRPWVQGGKAEQRGVSTKGQFQRGKWVGQQP
jgi:hypothetical protein